MTFSNQSLRLVAALLLAAAGCAKSAWVAPRDAALDASVDAALDAAVDANDGALDASITDASVATECTPGAVGCYGWSGAVPRICTAEGRWNPGTPCPAFCDQGACVRCLPGYSRCEYAFDGGPTDICTSDYTIVASGCSTGLCVCGDIPGPCWQSTGECGRVNDGLGGFADCDAELGGCPDGFACGTGSSANLCVPTIPGATKECTPGEYECGGPTERRCSRTGKWLALLPGEPCGTPAICASHGYDCGLTNDPFIGMVECGTCPSGYVCGRWSENRCAPSPSTAGAPR